MNTTKQEDTMKKTSDLNPKELAVLRACVDGPATLEEMSKRFRRADGDSQKNSWARNSVRKPVRLGLLKKQGRGTYGLTPKGREKLAGSSKAEA